MMNQHVKNQPLINQKIAKSTMNSPQMTQQNPQQVNSQQLTTQQMNAPHKNSLLINSQPMNLQQMNPQQMNSQQTSLQQMNSQQSNMKQTNQQINSKPANAQMSMHISPQNKGSQAALKPPANQRNEKVQKSRVYNNTNTSTKMMNSQNLAKFLLQSTYPVLPYNSFHNASHHPMLNRGAVFTNSQFINNHPMFNNQRTNGTYNNVNRYLNTFR